MNRPRARRSQGAVRCLLSLSSNCITLQVRELEPILCQAGSTSHLIWTSSSNAHRSAFDLEDIQHRRGTQPYSSSKYASDLLSLAINTHHNNQVRGHTQFITVTCQVKCG